VALTRRDLLRAAAASGLAAPLGCSLFQGSDSGSKDLIVHSVSPHNAEPRVDKLASAWITPYRHFYIRSHGTTPEIDPDAYALTVEGLVERPLLLRMGDLERMPKATAVSTLHCAENRKSEHDQARRVEGIPWEAGAVGTAEWRGPALGAVLARSGLKPAAKHVWLEGLDAVTLQDRQTLFGGTVPLEKAMKPESMLALEMNGLPLPREHGYPVRAVIPGHIGARSVKWLGRIVVADRPSENVFVARAYKVYPPDATAETIKPATVDPIGEGVLSSVICRPRAGGSIRAGRVELAGYAVPSGEEGAAIASVQVSGDGGSTWTAAELTGNEAPFAWRLWRATLELAAGAATLVVRAVDARGKTQPGTAPWNLLGYLYNGWHRVPVTVL